MKTKVCEVPEGEYVCEIIDMQATIDGKDRQVVTWFMKVVGGQYNGHLIEKKYYVVSQKVATLLKADLLMVGVDAPTALDFEANKQLAYGRRVKIGAKMNEEGYMTFCLKGIEHAVDLLMKGIASVRFW